MDNLGSDLFLLDMLPALGYLLARCAAWYLIIKGIQGIMRRRTPAQPAPACKDECADDGNWIYDDQDDEWLNVEEQDTIPELPAPSRQLKSCTWHQEMRLVEDEYNVTFTPEERLKLYTARAIVEAAERNTHNECSETYEN